LFTLYILSDGSNYAVYKRKPILSNWPIFA